MFTERFSNDDVVHRLAKVAAMSAVAACVVAAPDVWGSVVEFAVAYVALRLVLIGLNVRAWRDVREPRDATAVYVVGCGLGVAFWVASLAVEGDAPVAPCVAGGAIELLVRSSGGGASATLRFVSSTSVVTRSSRRVAAVRTSSRDSFG